MTASPAVRTGSRSTSLANRGPILGGAAVAVALLSLLQALWESLALAAEISVFADNLMWWSLASALLAALAGGLVAGAGSPGQRTAAGFVSGIAVWVLVLVAISALWLVASSMGLDAAASVGVESIQGSPQLGAEDPAWASLATVIGGLVATGAGGVLGGIASPGAREQGL